MLFVHMCSARFTPSDAALEFLLLNVGCLYPQVGPRPRCACCDMSQGPVVRSTF